MNALYMLELSHHAGTMQYLSPIIIAELDAMKHCANTAEVDTLRNEVSQQLGHTAVAAINRGDFEPGVPQQVAARRELQAIFHRREQLHTQLLRSLTWSNWAKCLFFGPWRR